MKAFGGFVRVFTQGAWSIDSNYSVFEASEVHQEGCRAKPVRSRMKDEG